SPVKGTVRVMYSYKSQSTATVYADIRKNSVSQDIQSQVTSTYVAKTYDLAVEAGDLIEIFLKGSVTSFGTFLHSPRIGVGSELSTAERNICLAVGGNWHPTTGYF
ncbi:unnamed protein product, partial [marine sediment metagenome]